ncbi:MAG TPA: hypothetical protein VN920_07865 [Pyrinomonadaceae bacterium]|nr:hypothetical protein [Pyrinomonadaceae bacterium]
MGNPPPLKPLHVDSNLTQVKLDQFSKLTTDELTESLKPGQPGSLKTRADGTMIEGHHRVRILQGRGVDVDALPREIVLKDA